MLGLFCAPVIVSETGLFGLVSGKEELSVVPSDLPFFGSLASSSVVGVNVLDPYALPTWRSKASIGYVASWGFRSPSMRFPGARK